MRWGCDPAVFHSSNSYPTQGSACHTLSMEVRRRLREWVRWLRIHRWESAQQRLAVEQRNAVDRDDMRRRGVLKIGMPTSGIGY